MRASRRSFVAGLASLPTITATTATVAAASADPIFAAIARHRAAIAALETADERARPGAYAACEQELCASHDALFNTEPQTLSGCKALAAFMIENADGVEGQGLDLLSQALDRLA